MNVVNVYSNALFLHYLQEPKKNYDQLNKFNKF